VAGLDYEKKGLLAVGTARLHTDCFAATLFDHLRVVLDKRAATVRTAYFSHFVSSLEIIERLGRQAGRNRRR
jgi:hypothetical protein